MFRSMAWKHTPESTSRYKWHVARYIAILRSQRGWYLGDARAPYDHGDAQVVVVRVPLPFRHAVLA